MESRIAEMINEEVERRVSEKIGTVLEYIAKTYDVNIKQLMKDAASIQTDSELCMGLTAKNKRCGNKTCKKHKNGYCSKHQKQKTNIVKTTTQSLTENIHTHATNLFFVKGCPGCEKKSEHKVNIDI
jgi:hypothetical protein